MANSVSEDDIRQELGVKVVEELLEHLSSLENALFLDDDDMKSMNLSVDCKTAIRKLKCMGTSTTHRYNQNLCAMSLTHVFSIIY